MLKAFPFIPQHDAMDCGPACLAMIAKHYGKEYTLQFLRDNAYLTREGVSLIGLSEAGKLIGFDSLAVRTNIHKIIEENPLPCVILWNNAHFVVLYKIRKRLLGGGYVFSIADPGTGKIRINEEQFRASWANQGESGVCLLIEPSDAFYKMIPPPKERFNWKLFLSYVLPFKKEIFQLLLGLAVSSMFTLIFPFLTQYLIDRGIVLKDLKVVFIILLSQIFVFLGGVVIDIVRNWLVLYIGARINIMIISDFFKKVLKLPVKFFETKFLGDFYQRIQDHSRIEDFLTSQSLTTIFSLVNFLIFFFVLFHYDYKILLVYSTLTILAIIWSRAFLKKREKLDYFRFASNAVNQEAVGEMIYGINDIKLNNFENFKRDEWEKVQVKLFRLNISVLKIDQIQMMGFDFINQLKNIVVTFLAAREVIVGNITLGAVLSISYIIGQMNSPVNQLVVFFRSYQDARLSMKRLTEVQNHEEEDVGLHKLTPRSINIGSPAQKNGISIKNLCFQYEGPQSLMVLKNVNLFIPEGKTTAIVGSSGSGKTTLMKLLLKFYRPTSGEILVNGESLQEIISEDWRKNCGTVLQDGFVFAGTIDRNIATKDEEINEENLENAIQIANLKEFIESLPSKGQTKIGASGNGISGGQRQRILIARSVYKKPQYIFFDEATSALDTENELQIHNKLKDFFKNKTVVIIAHRLSTVKNADQIVVMKNGEVSEQGTHHELVAKRNTYFNLVRNQLELESS